MKKKKAFTLIELLVVIAIIALLLSIIMPALRRVKDQAKVIMCKANIRSVALTVNLYAEDHDGKMFPYGDGLFINELSAYTEDLDDIRYCPSTKKMDENVASSRWGSSSETWCWASGLPEPEQGAYGLNGWIYYYDPAKTAAGDYNWVEPQLESYVFPSYIGITTPSSVPVFLDAVWVDLWPKHTDTVPVNLDLTQEILNTGTDYPVNNHIRRAMIDRHFGLCPMSFADGHVESSKLKHMWTHKWSREFSAISEMERDDGSPIYPQPR